MSVNNSAMSAAFTSGAGFSGDEISAFMVGILAVVVMIWALVLLIGWMQGAQRAVHFVPYLFVRLVILGFLLTVLLALLGSSS